jgi:hypothetical protein
MMSFEYTSVRCLLLGMAVTLHPVVLNSQSQPAISNPVPLIGQPLAPARATPGAHGLYYDHLQAQVFQWRATVLITFGGIGPTRV